MSPSPIIMIYYYVNSNIILYNSIITIPVNNYKTLNQASGVANWFDQHFCNKNDFED